MTSIKNFVSGIAGDEYEYFYSLTGKYTGIMLNSDKRYLVDSRLHEIARLRGYASVAQLLQALQKNFVLRTLALECAEAMATHETSFFRDRQSFEDLIRIVMPRLLQKNATHKRLRIWCAACSTGQEAYSLAISLRGMGKALDGWSVEIVGTDFVDETLEKARAARYTSFELRRGLQASEIATWFHKVEDDTWELNPDLRKNITFKKQNLMDDFSVFGQFDLVLARHVLMYFDEVTRLNILRRFAAMVRTGGYFAVGRSEVLLGIQSVFTRFPPASGFYTGS